MTGYANTHFSIVIASYNNERFCEENLGSCLHQDYDNYHIYYVNDGSTDRTYERVQQVIKKFKAENKITLINNKVRKKSALANQDYVIRDLIPDDSVCVIVDGDDWLYGAKTLQYLDSIYSKGHAWATLGQFRYLQQKVKIDHTPPEEVKKHRAYRYYMRGPFHLRTFYAFLYKQIDVEDLKEDGHFVQYASDVPLFFPIMEMAGEHLYFLDKVLYVYRDDNPIGECADQAVFQRQKEVASKYRMKKRYPIYERD